MNTHHRQSLALLALCIGGPVFGATLVQTFESGEDTTNWGSAGWSNYGTGPAFLDSSVGGTLAALGSSQVGQQATRSFRNNTVGISVETESYTVSLYIGLSQGDPAPSSGNFHIIDGDFGQRAVDISLEGYTGVSPVWKASNGGGSVTFTNIGFSFDTPYLVSFTVNPIAQTYSATISQVSAVGAVLLTQTLNDLSIGAGVVGNHASGQLSVHVEGSAGNTLFKADNISITDEISPIPEPASAAMLGALVALGAVVTRRRSRAHG